MSDHWGLLASALVAIIGWFYVARRGREQMRRQHTFNVLLTVSFNEDYHKNLSPLRAYLRGDATFPKTGEDSDSPFKEATYILNHYEFVAAGIRTGDIDERLLKDSEKGTIIVLYKTFNEYIYKARVTRERDTIYEHIEWLYGRWCDKPPEILQRVTEFVIGKPLQGKRR